MRFFSLGLSALALAPSAFGLSITSPSSSSYWVQFSTNTIAWQVGPNDPTSVSLQIINTNTTQLNGVFAIAEYVQASLQSFTITNVTLVVAEGYAVQMVNPANHSIIYATSGTFGVKPSGTTPAPVTGMPASNSSSTANSSASSSSNGRMTGNSSSLSNNATANGNARSSPASAPRAPLGFGMAGLAAVALLRCLI